MNKVYVVIAIVGSLLSINAKATTAAVTCVCTSYAGYGDGQFAAVPGWKVAGSLTVTPDGEKYVSNLLRNSSGGSKPMTLGFWMASKVFSQSAVDSYVAQCKEVEKADPSLSACALVVPPASQWEKR